MYRKRQTPDSLSYTRLLITSLAHRSPLSQSGSLTASEGCNPDTVTVGRPAPVGAPQVTDTPLCGRVSRGCSCKPGRPLSQSLLAAGTKQTPAAYKHQTPVSHSSRGCGCKIGGPGFQVADCNCSFCPPVAQGDRNLSGVSLIRA